MLLSCTKLLDVYPSALCHPPCWRLPPLHPKCSRHSPFQVRDEPLDWVEWGVAVGSRGLGRCATLASQSRKGLARKACTNHIRRWRNFAALVCKWHIPAWPRKRSFALKMCDLCWRSREPHRYSKNLTARFLTSGNGQLECLRLIWHFQQERVKMQGQRRLVKDFEGEGANALWFH